MSEKRIYRSTDNKMLCGVCAGLADYFNIDPTIVRLVWILIACTGTGIFAYIIAAIIMPEKS